MHRKLQIEHAGQTTCLGESSRVGEVSEVLASEMVKEDTHISSDTCAVGRVLTLIISKDVLSVPPENLTLEGTVITSETRCSSLPGVRVALLQENTGEATDDGII